MSDRVCIRGCITRGEHADDCKSRDSEQNPCRGCRPRLARHMAYVCDGCYSRFGKLLGDVADLLARLVSLDDPTKATPTDQEHFPGGVMTVAPAPVHDDRLDARIAIETNLAEWAIWAEGADTARLPHTMQAGAVRDRLDDIVNDKDHVIELAEAVLNIHRPDEHGVREAWSIWDAVKKWGVEREPAPREHWSDEPNSEETDESSPIQEWRDNRIISRAAAEGIAGTPRTLQRWVKDGLISRVGTITMPDENGRLRPTHLFREQEVIALKAKKDAEEKSGQFGASHP